MSSINRIKNRLSHCTGGPDDKSSLPQAKEINDKRLEMQETIIMTNTMIVCIENPKESTYILLENKRKLRKEAGYKAMNANQRHLSTPTTKKKLLKKQQQRT